MDRWPTQNFDSVGAVAHREATTPQCKTAQITSPKLTQKPFVQSKRCECGSANQSVETLCFHDEAHLH